MAAFVISSMPNGTGYLKRLVKSLAMATRSWRVFGLHVADVVFILFVGLHAPLVEGMSFTDVDGEKIGVVLVIVIELNDVANLATEGRSSEAAENENEGTAGSSFANVEIRGAIEGDKAGIGSSIPHFQVAPMHVREGVAHHVKGVFRATRHEAKKDKHANQ